MSAIRMLWAKKPGSQSVLFAFEQDGRVGFINAKGHVVVAASIPVPIEDVSDFSDGLARVAQKGYVDETGRFAIERDFGSDHDFSDGVAIVGDLVIDTTGKTVGQLPTDRTDEYSEGLVAFEAEGKPGVRKLGPGTFFYRDYPGLKGFLDRTGNIAIQPQFAEVGPFVGGLARAVLDGYCHIATWNGGRQGSPTSGYPGDCGGAPADAISPCKVGFIDRTGAFAIQPRFEAAEDFREGLAAVRIDGLWGFIDTNGTLVITPRFEQVRWFQEGQAAVLLKGKWGFIDKTGRITIAPRFPQVESFSDSLAIVHAGAKFFYIDRTGRTAIAGPFREVTPFVNGLAAVLLSDKHVAYIDHSGKTVFDYMRQ